MYIGLDIGTSGSKADLIDKHGTVLGSGQVSYSFSKTSGGYRELDAQAVWEAAVKCLYEAASGQHVESITVSARLTGKEDLSDLELQEQISVEQKN